MAIINCPECNGTISDKAEACVHCGCKVTVCPECNSAMVGDVSVCPNCGYRIRADKALDAKTASAKTDLENKSILDLKKTWINSGSGISTYFYKYRWFLFAVLGIIGVFSVIHAGKLYFDWFEDYIDGGNALFHSQSVIEDVEQWLIVGVIFLSLIWLINAIMKQVKITELSTWIKTRELNVEGIINNTLDPKITQYENKEKDDISGFLNDIIRVHRYSLDPSSKYGDMLRNLAAAAVIIVSYILDVIVVKDLLSALMSDLIWNYSSELGTYTMSIQKILSFINWTPLVISFALNPAGDFILKRLEKNYTRTWIKKVFPHRADSYAKLTNPLKDADGYEGSAPPIDMG